MLPAQVKERMLSALRSTIEVIDEMLAGISPEHPVWSFRPDPDRFTLTEVLAHLNDWDAIWLERMLQTRQGSTPTMPAWDTEELASINNYPTLKPYDSLESFRQRRAQILNLLHSLSEEEWLLGANHSEFGFMSLELQAIQVLSHDGYHTGQIAQWLMLCRKDSDTVRRLKTMPFKAE